MIEVLARRPPRVILGWEAQSETISDKAGKDMQVDMKHFLHRRRPVSEEEIDALASDPLAPRPRAIECANAIRCAAGSWSVSERWAGFRGGTAHRRPSLHGWVSINAARGSAA